MCRDMTLATRRKALMILAAAAARSSGTLVQCSHSGLPDNADLPSGERCGTCWPQTADGSAFKGLCQQSLAAQLSHPITSVAGRRGQEKCPEKLGFAPAPQG
jgi:hypothetical protein